MDSVIGLFLQQYQRKAQRGGEPNDRQYDRKIERYIRRMKPEELDKVLNGEEDDRLDESWKAKRYQLDVGRQMWFELAPNIGLEELGSLHTPGLVRLIPAYAG